MAARAQLGLPSRRADQLPHAPLEIGLLLRACGREFFDGGGEVVVTDALPGIEQAAHGPGAAFGLRADGAAQQPGDLLRLHAAGLGMSKHRQSVYGTICRSVNGAFTA